MVGAGQAPAVLLQVVPGILVEMGHLAGERGSETGWNLSPTGLPQALSDVTGTKPGDSSREWVTSMRKKLVQGMNGTPLGHLATRVKLRAQEGASLPPPRRTSKRPRSQSRLPAPKSLRKAVDLTPLQRETGLPLPPGAHGKASSPSHLSYPPPLPLPLNHMQSPAPDSIT